MCSEMACIVIGWFVGFNHLPHRVGLDRHDRTIVRGRESGQVYNVHSQQLCAPMGRWRSQPVEDDKHHEGNAIRVITLGS